MRLTITLPAELHQRVRAEAEEQERSVSWLIAKALEAETTEGARRAPRRKGTK